MALDGAGEIRQALGMRFFWYLAQSAFIAWLTYGVATTHPAKSPGEVMIVFVIAVSLCAFLTACLTQLWDWCVRRLRGLKGHRGEPSRDGLGLIGTRRSSGEPAEQRKRIGVGE